VRKEKKINYHDTDAVGIAYYGSYLHFLEESRTRFLEERGIPVKGLHESGRYFIVKFFKASYKRPVCFGDVIICQTSVNKITAARITFAQTVFNKQTGEAVVESDVELVMVDNVLRPVLLPDEVMSALQEEMEV